MFLFSLISSKTDVLDSLEATEWTFLQLVKDVNFHGIGSSHHDRFTRATIHLETDLFVTDVITRRRSRRGSDGRLSGQLGRRRGWISWKFVESVVVKSLKFKELAVSIDRRSGGWMVGKLGSIIIVTKVAGTIHVKFDIKLASRNDLAFQRTALVIAHLVVIGKLATGWTTGSHASSEQRSVVVVRAVVVLVVSSSTVTDDCVLFDENRACNEVDTVIFVDLVENIPDGLFQKGGLVWGEWHGSIETRQSEVVGAIGRWKERNNRR